MSIEDYIRPYTGDPRFEIGARVMLGETLGPYTVTDRRDLWCIFQGAWTPELQLEDAGWAWARNCTYVKGEKP